MKNLLKTTALIAITSISASSVFAETTGDTKWKGSTPAFAEGCTFVEFSSSAAVMTYSEVNHKWSATNAAAIIMSARSVASVVVSSEGDVVDEAGAFVSDATVKYNQGSVPSTIVGASGLGMGFTSVLDGESTINVTGLDNAGYVERFTLNVGGNASMDSSSSDDLLSNTNYLIHHLITCTQ